MLDVTMFTAPRLPCSRRPAALRVWLVAMLALSACDGPGEPDASGVDAGSSTRDSGVAAMDAARPDAARQDASAQDAASTDSGAAGDAALIDSGPPPRTGIELITDRRFARGFNAQHPVSGAVVGTMSPGFASGAPAWQLGQWGSATSLSDATQTTLASGAVRWEDRYGALIIGPAGAAEADLTFRVDAVEEYGGVYRAADATRTWPHLLGEQRLSPPGAEGPGCPPLTELDQLIFSADARLLYDRQNRRAGYDPSRHAAQYLIYFTIQNLRDPAAPGYGDYLWFGLTLYDDRTAAPGLAVSGDDATGKLIYNIGLTPLTAGSLTDNEWHSLRADLLPHIRLALEEAWRRGYLPDSHDLADYRIGGMNLGWEIPGLNTAELQLRDLSLTYTSAAAPGERRFDFSTDGDREGWTAGNLGDPDAGPRGGVWTLVAADPDPVLQSPALGLPASEYRAVEVTLANDGNPAASARMQLFWSTAAEPAFSEARSLWLDVSNDGSWSTYRFDVSAAAGWAGTINRVRIDPIMYGDGHTVRVDQIVIAP